MKFSLKCAAIVLVFAIMANSVSAAGVSFGIKGGLNLAKVRTDEGFALDQDLAFSKDDTKMKPGMIIGGVFGLNLNEMFTIQPEILFSMKGTKFERSEMGIDVSMDINYNYLEIPVLFKLNIPAGIIIPNLYVGPAVAFRLGLSGEMGIGDETIEFTDDMIEMLEEYSKSVDFGLAMGGGIDFKAGKGNIVIDIRYTLGFLKVAKLTDEMEDAGMTDDDLPDPKNGVLSFMIGYTFNIGI